MTHTTTIIERGVFGNLKYRMAKLDITAHVASGVTIAPEDFGLTKIRWVEVNPVSESLYIAKWNGALKVQCFTGATGVCVDAGTADVGEVHLMVYGI